MATVKFALENKLESRPFSRLQNYFFQQTVAVRCLRMIRNHISVENA
jgi:hypothetical protein